MKQNYILLFFSLILALFGGCKKDIDEVQPINVNVQLSVNPEEVWFEVPYDKAKITLINKGNGSSYKLQADTKGKISLHNIAPGNYSINVSLAISAEEYTKLTGVNRSSIFYLNYALADKALFADEDFNIGLVTSEPVGGFVIKQIYYAGSDTKEGALNRDNFIEIYNNSDETLYADSLLVVLAYGKPNNKTDEYSLSNNQYDWSKSINMAVSDNANEDYVYAKGIFMIPSDGTGKKYPVESGKSIIIAGSALNYAGSYKDNNGNIIGAQKPELTVDLSNADFEAWLYPYEQKIQPGRTIFANDVDNPSVTNVEVFLALSMRDMYFPPQARESFVLMKADGNFDLNNIPSFAIPTIQAVTTSTVRYAQMPARFILDAIEIQEPVVAEQIPRRLPQRFDAGAISVPGGAYSSQSIVRKTEKKIGNRRILKDTNNSSNDFGVLQRANPTKTDASFID
ncbi:DUF4876 domain-containing protein [Sphingobacterium sp. UBA5996]|uniref:DUF4876 domain-containing protein n=1 Tax=Sphingobacterium sp. UBA5996 TaxID=1947505 RepID=UPI0025F57740|nr:DUF4876 domain-containing protein [Sphingobacterium sp. UBA5996]